MAGVFSASLSSALQNKTASLIELVSFSQYFPFIDNLINSY